MSDPTYKFEESTHVYAAPSPHLAEVYESIALPGIDDCIPAGAGLEGLILVDWSAPHIFKRSR